MATDLVLVAESVEKNFRSLLRDKMSKEAQQVMKVINTKSQVRIDALINDAKKKGAISNSTDRGPSSPATLLEDITQDMDFWSAESFGPLLGLVVYGNEDEAVEMVNCSSYGLSGAVFSCNHLKALRIAKKLQTSAVHVNSTTVHDEFALPHGGRKESGWGRFGAHWGFEEFLQTKTIILHP